MRQQLPGKLLQTFIFDWLLLLIMVKVRLVREEMNAHGRSRIMITRVLCAVCWERRMKVCYER